MPESAPWFASIPWFAWIAIVGAVVGGVVAIFGAGRSKRQVDPDVARVLAENTAVNQALLAKLTAIDDRLGAVEKTLNDIPG